MSDDNEDDGFFEDELGLSLPFDPSKPIEDQLPPNLPEGAADMIRKAMQRIVGSRINTSQVVDKATKTLMPSDVQLALAPGDWCIQQQGVKYGSNTGEPLTLIEVLEPEEHVEEFPDWETRVFNSYVLGRYWTHLELGNNVDEPDIGWFSRVHLCKLSEDWQREEIRSWIRENSPPSVPPAWLVQLMVDMAYRVGKANDDFVPAPAHCDECGSSAVMLNMSQAMTDLYFCGHRTVENYDYEHNYWSYGQYARIYEQHKVLSCMACGHDLNLEDEAYQVHLGVTPESLAQHV